MHEVVYNMFLIREVHKSVEKTVLFHEMVSFISLSTLHVCERKPILRGCFTATQTRY